MRRLFKNLTATHRIRNHLVIYSTRKSHCNVAKMIQASLSRVSPTMSINKVSLKLIQKIGKEKFLSPAHKSREVKGILNYASGNSLLIFVLTLNTNPWRGFTFMDIYQVLSFTSSVPKVLLIYVADKKQRNYKKVFSFFEARIINVDILEISTSNRKTKKGLMPKKHDFGVHKYNPFSRVYKTAEPSKKLIWFESKMMNLHKFKMPTFQWSPSHTRVATREIHGKRRSIRIYLDGPNSMLGKHFKGSLNCTFKILPESFLHCDFTYPLRLAHDGYRPMPYLTPIDFQIAFIYTPVIYERLSMDRSLKTIAVYFIAGLVPLMLLSIMGALSTALIERTLSPISMIRVYLGQTSYQNPKTWIKCAIFYFAVFSAFFFYADFSEKLTDALVPVEVERQFNNFFDLKDCNLTLYLAFDPKLNYEAPARNYFGKFIINSNITYKTYFDKLEEFCIKEMMYSKNVSISIPLRSQSPNKYSDTLYD